MGEQKLNQVRIIAGSLRGRKITFAESSQENALRPTPDRVRETLFNWLSTKILGAECLDAFAGSGALGLEAISRGAKHVTLLEKHPQIMKNIRENAERFKIEASQLTFSCIDTLAYLTQTSQTFDIIFLDPPFQQDLSKSLLMPSIQCIAQRGLLRSGGYLYTESSTPITQEDTPPEWMPIRAKKAGNVYYGFFTVSAPH